MLAEIISIGDELLVGQVINTNASWIAHRLHMTGIGVRQVTAIADKKETIINTLSDALLHSDLVLITGGLGPTKDDITKDALCEFFNTGLIFHEPTYENIRKFFLARGLEVTGRNRRQAEIPEACKAIPNDEGTAAGMWFEKDGKVVVSMPGVPYEMETMMERYIIPMLGEREHLDVVAHKTVLTTGMGESFLTEVISDWEDALPSNIKLAYLPQPGIVRLRLTAMCRDKAECNRLIEEQVGQLRGLIPQLIFGYEDDTLEEIVGRLLVSGKKTVSTAESCTGGYISHLLTSVPGASRYFMGTIVAYSYEMKEELLGVSHETLLRYGAVSEQVVKEMATGARHRFRTDYALSVSGIAGPGGGLPAKPVGTVWIGLAGPKGVSATGYHFGEHRQRNIRRAAVAALNMLRMELSK